MLDNIYPPTAVHGEMRCRRIWLPSLGGQTRVPNIVRKGGKSRLSYKYLPGKWLGENEFASNLVLYEWATIVGELLRKAPDKKPYGLGGMYIEFENNAGAPAAVPAVDRNEGRSYYDELLTSSNRDYLRVPLIATTLTSTDEIQFPAGNRVTAFAQTEGVTGVHGKVFSASQQSRIYGAALVAFPEFADATQDLVFSRFYYSDSDNQMIKITGSQIGIEWRLNLL